MDGFIERISVLQQPLGELLPVVANHSLHPIRSSASSSTATATLAGAIIAAIIDTSVHVGGMIRAGG